MRQNTKPLEKARRQQKRFQGAAVQIAAIMRFVDERIAEGITDEHDLANQPSIGTAKPARIGPRLVLCSMRRVSSCCRISPS
jgi:hypothetical protein